jgi:N utilization substance protein A
MEENSINSAIEQICRERGIDEKTVIATIEAALAAAYKKDFGNPEQLVKVKFDLKTGGSKIYEVKEIVEKEELKNPAREITLTEAKKKEKKKKLKIGDTIEKRLETPAGYGRIAAQTAKQVIIQRVREAERDIVFDEYKKQEGQLINGVVQRLEGDQVLIDLGKATGIIFREGQIPTERYHPGQRLRAFLERVEETPKGPQVVVSRTNPKVVQQLFELEIPEIGAGTVEIKAIAREAGVRSKVAVHSKEKGVDPIGSCVGQRGARVQAIISELGGEKLDIVLWDKDLQVFITNALSPAKIVEVKIDEKNQSAQVMVPTDQLSLAIGKGGQNVRLASKLTGYKLDVVEVKGESDEKAEVKDERKKVTKDKKGEKKTVKKESQKTEKKKKDKPTKKKSKPKTKSKKS